MQATMETSTQINDGRADFDFLHGKWKGSQRRLRERLNNCTEWEEFESTSVVRALVGVPGNIDEVTMERESGNLHGVTVRLFDPISKEWSIYWADSKNPIVFTPMIGHFENGRGEFYAHETFHDKHIFVRFIWLVNSPDSCHWEQAFSPDGGKTWETNWTMEFARLE